MPDATSLDIRDIQTYYISREISIEHPSVGLASLAQSRETSIEPPLASLAQITISAHAREGYSSRFVCHSVTVCHFFILEKAPFSGLKLTSILGDDLSVLNVALF